MLTDSTQQLKAVSKRIGSSAIEKARPYFEALEAAKKAQKECQAAATAYQRAFGVHAAAKVTCIKALGYKLQLYNAMSRWFILSTLSCVFCSCLNEKGRH